MDFTEKMKKAMTMLHEACKTNENWADCRFCPFDECCDAIAEAGLVPPYEDSFCLNSTAGSASDL